MMSMRNHAFVRQIHIRHLTNIKTNLLNETSGNAATDKPSSAPSVLIEPGEQSNINKDVIRNKNELLRRIFNYMEEVSHMDEVRKTQEIVMEIKTQLRSTGDKKRRILQDLEAVRRSLFDIYSDMKIMGSRGSEKYMILVREELELCKKERQLQEEYVEIDSREQNLFNDFSTAINDSYEKEKIHSNFLKVLGVFGTILASLLTLGASICGHLYHQHKLKSIRTDIHTTVSQQVLNELEKVNNRLKSLEKPYWQNASNSNTNPTESWGSYLNRHTRWLYGWAIPKK